MKPKYMAEPAIYYNGKRVQNVIIRKREGEDYSLKEEVDDKNNVIRVEEKYGVLHIGYYDGQKINKERLLSIASIREVIIAYSKDQSSDWAQTRGGRGP
jgi:hypothetical protein